MHTCMDVTLGHALICSSPWEQSEVGAEGRCHLGVKPVAMQTDGGRFDEWRGTIASKSHCGRRSSGPSGIYTGFPRPARPLLLRWFSLVAHGAF